KRESSLRTAPAVVKAPDNRAPINTDARLTKLVEKLVSRGGVHHTNVSIASGDGDQQWSAAAGPADYVPQPDTPFFIASITKRCITTLVLDRKSTRLNSSHVSISYAVFCFK